MEYRYLSEYPGYALTENGTIISKKTKKPMRLSKSHKGYLVVSVINKDNLRKRASVARLIATAWHGEPLSGMQVNHKKGIKTDNRPSEIEWTTQSENMRHSYRELGRENRRKRDGLSPNSKLDRLQVAVIRDVIKTYNLTHVARYFKVNRKSIQNIKTLVTWVKN
jgi:hypothetical protein